MKSLGAEPVLFGDDRAERVKSLAASGLPAIVDCAGHGSLVIAMAAAAPKNARICSIADGGSGQNRLREGRRRDASSAREYGGGRLSQGDGSRIIRPWQMHRWLKRRGRRDLKSPGNRSRSRRRLA